MRLYPCFKRVYFLYLVQGICGVLNAKAPIQGLYIEFISKG